MICEPSRHDATCNVTDRPTVVPALRRLRSEMIFEPERGNVAFGSAIHGWAFRTHDFAALYV